MSEAGTIPISDKKVDNGQPSEFSLDLSPTHNNNRNSGKFLSPTNPLVSNRTKARIIVINVAISVDYSISPRKLEESSLSTSKNKGNL